MSPNQLHLCESLAKTSQVYIEIYVILASSYFQTLSFNFGAVRIWINTALPNYLEVNIKSFR